MKTLVYCTSFAANPQDWEARYDLWVRSVRHSGLRFDQLLIADDASPSMPAWPDAEIIRQRAAPDPADVRSRSPILIYRHDQRRGRNSTFDFPGWHRSFAFGALYAHAHGFERVVHLESDAHLASGRIAWHFNHIEAGWFALWSRKYWMPEMAIQVAAGPQVAELAAFARKPYANMIGRPHEDQLPYSHISHLYRGDRYTETLDQVPLGVDFATQTPSDRPVDYYWWMKATRPTVLPPIAAEPVCIGPSELQDDRLFECDWSSAEPDHRWMVDFDSQIRLPGRPLVPHVLELDLQPFAAPGRALQHLLVMMNERLIGEFDIFQAIRLFCDVPAESLNENTPNMVRLIHRDGLLVTDILPHAADSRRLSLALMGLRLKAA